MVHFAHAYKISNATPRSERRSILSWRQHTAVGRKVEVFGRKNPKCQSELEPPKGAVRVKRTVAQPRRERVCVAGRAEYRPCAQCAAQHRGGRATGSQSVRCRVARHRVDTAHKAEDEQHHLRPAVHRRRDDVAVGVSSEGAWRSRSRAESCGVLADVLVLGERTRVARAHPPLREDPDPRAGAPSDAIPHHAAREDSLHLRVDPDVQVIGILPAPPPGSAGA